MSAKRKHPHRPGARVVLDSPHGELRRGTEAGALILVVNGARGVVVGASGTDYVVVAWDDIGQTVGVSTPQHWLAPETP